MKAIDIQDAHASVGSGTPHACRDVRRPVLLFPLLCPLFVFGGCGQAPRVSDDPSGIPQTPLLIAGSNAQQLAETKTPTGLTQALANTNILALDAFINDQPGSADAKKAADAITSWLKSYQETHPAVPVGSNGSVNLAHGTGAVGAGCGRIDHVIGSSLSLRLEDIKAPDGLHLVLNGFDAKKQFGGSVSFDYSYSVLATRHTELGLHNVRGAVNAYEFSRKLEGGAALELTVNVTEQCPPIPDDAYAHYIIAKQALQRAITCLKESFVLLDQSLAAVRAENFERSQRALAAAGEKQGQAQRSMSECAVHSLLLDDLSKLPNKLLSQIAHECIRRLDAFKRQNSLTPTSPAFDSSKPL